MSPEDTAGPESLGGALVFAGAAGFSDVSVRGGAAGGLGGPDGAGGAGPAGALGECGAGKSSAFSPGAEGFAASEGSPAAVDIGGFGALGAWVSAGAAGAFSAAPASASALATEGSIIIARMRAVALATAVQEAPFSSRTWVSALRASMRTQKLLPSRATEATTAIGAAGRAVRFPRSRSTFAMTWSAEGHSAGALQSRAIPASARAWDGASAIASKRPALASDWAR